MNREIKTTTKPNKQTQTQYKQTIRTEWARFFKKNNIKHLFWSANNEKLKQEGEFLEPEADMTAINLKDKEGLVYVCLFLYLFV